MLLRRETREWQKGKGEERLLFKAFKQMSMYKARYIFVIITRTTLTISFSKTLLIFYIFPWTIQVSWLTSGLYDCKSFLLYPKRQLL